MSFTFKLVYYTNKKDSFISKKILINRRRDKFMSKNKKWILLITIIIGVFFIKNYNSHPSHVQIPESKDIISITFINVNNDKGVKKSTIDKKSDINNLLDILKKAKKTNKSSTSDVPNKESFSLIIFKMQEGKVINSLYQENNRIYFEQPYYGIFELDFKNIEELKNIIEKGNNQDISVNIDDIFKDDF